MSKLKARKSTWDAEIQAQEEEIKCAAAEETWLCSKFTNKQLYTLLDNKIGSLYHATYLLASEMMNITKCVLDFEHLLKYPNSTMCLAELAPGLTGYWDDALHGQLAGETFYLDLKCLEMVHLENKPYDFKVTKAVSLQQINSIKLLKLWRTGSAQFSLPEVLFDMDYPGHYCQCISSVVVTIPCILGVYTSLNCTLRLNKHSYQISPNMMKEGYTKHSETDFHMDNIPIQAIAVSSGVEDTGGYSFHFLDGEKYGPFEGAGAVSTWNIDFPQTFGQFDYNTISDVVLHLHYTSLFNGGLAAVATDCAKDFIKGNDTATETPPHVTIYLKNDYPDQWHQIATGDRMTLSGLHNRLPYWAQRGTVTVGKVSLFLSQDLTGNPKINVSGADTWTEMSGATNLNNYCERSATFLTAVSWD